jgi:flagellin
MSSILTNTAAMTALRSLTMTQSNMEKTQNQISTGLKVASASDNAAYWSIATTMRSDQSGLAAVTDALGLGASTVDVAYTGVNAAIDMTKQIKDKLIAAAQPGVDRTKIQSEIKALQGQLKSIGDSSSFSGQNWLSVDSAAVGYNGTKSVISSVTRSATGISVGTIDVSLANVKLYDSNGKVGILDKESTTTRGAVLYSVANLDISGLTDSANDLADLGQMTKSVDAAISSMTTAASDLGSAKQRITSQKDFVTALSDAIGRGIGTLVDADMTQASTKLQALQVQQQLGTQALSMANQSSQSILSLFR